MEYDVQPCVRFPYGGTKDFSIKVLRDHEGDSSGAALEDLWILLLLIPAGVLGFFSYKKCMRKKNPSALALLSPEEIDYAEYEPPGNNYMPPERTL
jgi:hypothetical protein